MPISYEALLDKYAQFYTTTNTDNQLATTCVNILEEYSNVDDVDDECDDDDDEFVDEDVSNLTKKIHKDNDKCERMNKPFEFTYFESNNMNNRIEITQQSDQLYLLTFEHLLNNFKQPSKNFFLNIQGAIVKKLTKNLFVSHNDTKLVVADFSSMYSSVMDRYNVCASSLCFFNQYPSIIDGKMVYCANDVNNCFYKFPIEIKTNGVMIPLLIYMVKRDYCKSVNSKIISDCRSERKKIKAQMKMFEQTSFQYKQLNLKQEFCKLLGNSLYGKQQDCKSPIFNPFCSAFVTKAGRGLLLNLFIFLKVGTQLLDKQNCTKTDVYLYYGDTDSVFISGNEKYIVELIECFNNLKKYQKIIQVEIEKVLDIGLFFNKKNYIMLYSKSNQIILKGLIKKSQAMCSRVFLFRFVHNFIWNPLRENNSELFEKTLVEMFTIFFTKTKSEDFFIRKRIKNNIDEYKQSTPILEQVRLLQQKYGIELDQFVNYTYYNRVFEFDFSVKEQRLMKKDMSTSANRKKLEQLTLKKSKFLNVQFDTKIPIKCAELKKFLHSDGRMSTVLVDELFKIYAQKYDNLLIDKQRVFVLDLKNIISKFELSLSNQKSTYSEVWSRVSSKFLTNQLCQKKNQSTLDSFVIRNKKQKLN